MRSDWVGAGVGLLLLFAPAVARAANGRVLMTWGDYCAPLCADITPTAGPVSRMFSVLGNDQTHNAYQVRFHLAADADGIPDAWRFDDAGCQDYGSLTINHTSPASTAKTCPNFQGNNSSIQIKQFKFVNPGSQYDPSRIMLGVLTNTYPAGFTTAAETRYFLAQFIFDHTRSVAGPTTPGVTCGGFDTGICVQLVQYAGSFSGTSYIRASDGVEVPFDPVDTPYVTIGGPLDCVAVPARAATWSQIKSQYRGILTR